MRAASLDGEQLRRIFDLAPIGIAITDAAGRFLHVNRAFQEMTGYSPEQLREMSYSKITPPEDAVLDLVGQSDLLRGEADWLRVERRLVHKSGRVFWCRGDMSVVRGQDGTVRHTITMLQNITMQKQAEEQLRRSEERYRQHFRAGHDMLFIIDRDLRVVDVSPSVSNVLGYRPEELVGKTIGQLGILTSEEYAEQARRDMEMVLSGGRMEMTPYQGYTKSGEIKHVEVSASPFLEDGKVTGVVVVVRDVSQRKAVEDALRESQRAMATLFSNIPGIVYRCRNDRDWTMELVSEGCLQLTGYWPEDLIGNKVVSYADIIHPHDRENVWDWVQQALAENRPHTITYRIITRAGEEKWVWEQGRGVYSPAGELVALEGLITDITDRKRAEEALAESENMLASIIDQSPISTWITDAEGTLIRQNAACRRLLGVADEQTIGKYNLFRDRHTYEQGIEETVRKVFTEGRTAHFTLDYDVSKAGCVEVPRGLRRLLDVTIFPVKDESGRVIYAVGQHEDITELHEKEEQLRQAQKMEAIGKLAGSIAHDFNNQLTVVKGYCDLLLASRPVDDPCYEPVEQISKAAKRAAALTGQLLAYSRKQMLHPQIVDVNRLLGELADPIRKIIGERISLKITPSADPATVRVDVGQVQQAITNIVLNARDAMPGGGTLTVETANAEMLPPSLGSPGESGPCPCVVLAISDTGTGMDQDTLSHIFEPFFTTKPPGRGTGLGLSMVYGFVQQSGERIDVTSRLGEGSTFRIYLPQVLSRPAGQQGTTAAVP